MLSTWALLLTLLQSPFTPAAQRALDMAQAGNWKEADAALAQAWSADPAAFDANSLHYLWGYSAESRRDWARAAEVSERSTPAAIDAAVRANGAVAA